MNTRMNFFLILFLILSNLVLIVFLLLGARRQGGPDGYPPEGPWFLVRELDFTSKQKDEFARLVEEHGDHMRPLMQEMMDAKLKLFGELQTGAVTGSVAQERASQIGAIQAKLDLEVFQHFSRVRQICDDAQRKKLDDLIVQGVRLRQPPPLKK